MRFLYKITNKLNGKVYIGQTRDVKRRWLEHKIAARSESPKTYIDQNIKNDGIENFIYEHIGTSKNKEDSNKTEIQLIAQYNSTDQNIGYNKSPGGDQFSDEYCQKMSEMRTGKGNPFYGKSHSVVSRGKISQFHVGFSGMKHSNEALFRISKAQTGKVFSEEHKNNISVSKSGKKQSSEVIAKQAKSRRKLTDEQENNIKNDTRGAKLIATEYGIKVSLVYAVRRK